MGTPRLSCQKYQGIRKKTFLSYIVVSRCICIYLIFSVWNGFLCHLLCWPYALKELGLFWGISTANEVWTLYSRHRGVLCGNCLILMH